MNILRIIFLFILISSCNAQQKFDIGSEIKDTTTLQKAGKILISPSHIEQSYYTVAEGIQYTICIDSVNRINYILTQDSNYITSDDVKIGMSYDDVRKHTNSQLILERGWAFFVPLNSGWNAAFLITDYDNPKMVDSTVKWLFKRR